MSDKTAKRRTQLPAPPVLVRQLPLLYLGWPVLSQQWDARSNASTSGSAWLLPCSPCNTAHHQVMIPCGCCCLLSSDLGVLTRSHSCWILTFPEPIPLTWDLSVCAGMNPGVPAGTEAWNELHVLR